MPEMNEELLLAALAVLTGAVPPDDLRAAMVTLAESPDGRLEQVLRERGLLDGERIAALRVLVAKHPARNQGDLVSGLEAWKGETLTHEILTEIEGAEQRTMLARTLAEAMGSTIQATESRGASELEATVAADPNATTGDVARVAVPGPRRELPRYTQEQRFERIELHARGGIGQVWRARDLELHREVALKEIRPNIGGQAGQNDRFLLEAEITGNLEHPGIVPVYSLGSDSQGRPFYAMRFIRGESLSEAIQKFHQARVEAAASRRPEWGVEFQQLLRRFLDVCDAMEYAHSRGVLHRDLKPANIMLGEYGETLVVDWGLAKVLGQANPAPGPPAPADDIAPPDDPVAGEDATMPPPPLAAGGITTSPTEHTVQGTKMGTPSYMSPEQARGEIDKLRKASDVYSLGATLYELLAGKRVHADLKAPEILVRVAKGDVPSPRTTLTTIPAALEAICMKAMAFLPEDRYESARDLALDLEHWIADEPVSAFPEGRAQRLGRWLRQHRTWTYAAAASLLVITLVSAVATVRLDAARRREGEARQDAEAGFDAALGAVNQYLTDVSENELLKKYDSFDVSGLRNQLLRSALPFYKNFVEKRAHDPRLREQLAAAYYRLGHITRFVGSSSEAMTYYRSALELWRALAAASPEDPERRLRVADCLFAIGEITDTAHSADAVASLTEALGIYDRAATARPDDPHLRQMIASCLSEIGFRQSLALKYEDALGTLDLARAVLEDLLVGDPGNPGYKKYLARVINRLGYVEYRRGRGDAAMELYGEFQKLCREIFDSVKEGPKPLEYEEMLATSYENIGAIQQQRGLLEPALQAYREAETHRVRMVELAGSVREYRFGLAGNYLSMALLEYRSQRIDESLAHAARSRAILEKLSGEDPDEFSYRKLLARVITLEGVIHDDSRRNDLALEPFKEALRILRDLELRPEEDLHLEIGVSLSNMGETYADLGQPRPAMEYYREALDRQMKLLTDRPNEPEHAAQVGGLAITLGDLQRQQGEPTEAAATFARAHEALARVTGPSPTGDRSRTALRIQLLDREARALSERGEPEEAAGRLEQAAGLGREALRGEDPDESAAACRGALSETLRDLAGLPLPGRPAAEADRLRAERADLWRGRPPQELLALATREAASADVIGYGKAPLPPTGARARRADRDVAASHLRIAFRRGLSDLDRLRSDPALGPLLRDGPATPDEEFPPIPAAPFRP